MAVDQKLVVARVAMCLQAVPGGRWDQVPVEHSPSKMTSRWRQTHHCEWLSTGSVPVVVLLVVLWWELS